MAPRVVAGGSSDLAAAGPDPVIGAASRVGPPGIGLPARVERDDLILVGADRAGLDEVEAVAARDETDRPAARRRLGQARKCAPVVRLERQEQEATVVEQTVRVVAGSDSVQVPPVAASDLQERLVDTLAACGPVEARLEERVLAGRLGSDRAEPHQDAVDRPRQGKVLDETGEQRQAAPRIGGWLAQVGLPLGQTTVFGARAEPQRAKGLAHRVELAAEALKEVDCRVHKHGAVFDRRLEGPGRRVRIAGQRRGTTGVASTPRARR